MIIDIAAWEIHLRCICDVLGSMQGKFVYSQQANVFYGTPGQTGYSQILLGCIQKGQEGWFLYKIFLQLNKDYNLIKQVWRQICLSKTLQVNIIQGHTEKNVFFRCKHDRLFQIPEQKLQCDFKCFRKNQQIFP